MEQLIDYRPVSVSMAASAVHSCDTPEVMRTVKKSATTLARGFDSEQAPSRARSNHSFRGLFDGCCGGRKARGITTRWWF